MIKFRSNSSSAQYWVYCEFDRFTKYHSKEVKKCLTLVKKQKKGEIKMCKTFYLNKQEVECFKACGDHSGKDNVLFFGESTKEVYLLLHGGNNGLVRFDNLNLNLKQVFHRLKNEDVFSILVTLNIKHIYVLCCHSYYQDSYEEDSFIIETYFHNKGRLLGKDFYLNNEYYYTFIEEEELVA